MIVEHVLQQSHLKDVPLLLLANKQDHHRALSPREIFEAMELPEIIDDRAWGFFGTSAVSGLNVSKAINWLISVIMIRSTHFSLTRANATSLNKKAFYQFISRFSLERNTTSCLKSSQDTTVALTSHEKLEDIFLECFVKPQITIQLMKLLQKEIEERVRQEIQEKLGLTSPNLTTLVPIRNLNPTWQFIDRSNKNMPQPNPVEKTLKVLKQLGEDWNVRESILAAMFSEHKKTEMTRVIFMHLQPLLAFHASLFQAAVTNAVREHEFVLKYQLVPLSIKQHFQHRQSIQELIWKQWRMLIETMKQQVITRYNKHVLETLIELNLPPDWLMLKDHVNTHWLVYKKIGQVPGPPFYLKILFEDDDDPRVQVILSCPECQNPLPTGFIPCIVLPDKREITLLDDHETLSQKYLLAFGKIMVLILYANALLEKKKTKPTRKLKSTGQHDIKADAEGNHHLSFIDQNIRSQFFEKFGMICSHYEWY